MARKHANINYGWQTAQVKSVHATRQMTYCSHCEHFNHCSQISVKNVKAHTDSCQWPIGYKINYKMRFKK